MRERPPAPFIAFAHQLIDAGVDILHGHSAHLFQGVEIYKGKLIFYDTGDFVDDYMVDPLLRNDLSFLFIIVAELQKPLSFRLVPVLISQFQVNRAQGEEAEFTRQRMVQLSLELGTSLTIKNGALELQ
jgi:poly-gamma-glutamate synthesis protein (capsule biosynthesis protein)